MVWKGTLVSTATSPIKVSIEADGLITQAAHFLGKAKKELVEVAVIEYIENHRAEIESAALNALQVLDGTRAGRVALLAGLTREELDDVGGVREA